jgi:hypothetical protein
MDRLGRIPSGEFHTLAEDLARLRANAEQAELLMKEIASLAGVSRDMRYGTIST